MNVFRRLIGFGSNRAASPTTGYKGLADRIGYSQSTGGRIPSRAAASCLDDQELFTACGKIDGPGRLKALLAAGANVNVCDEEGHTPLFVACQNGNVDAVKLLSGAGANLNSARNDGAIPIGVASYNGHADVVKALLEDGANIDAATKSGVTSLYSAAEQGHAEVMELILAAGAKGRCRQKRRRYPACSSLRKRSSGCGQTATGRRSQSEYDG